MPHDRLEACPRCGQLALQDAATVCEACMAAERAPQGEAVRLFEPAPAPMPGQVGLPDDAPEGACMGRWDPWQ